jgi:signal transduction histidine kinase
VTVSVAFSAAETRLVVTDDGRGFDQDEPRTGFGLLGLRERAALLGGTVTVSSSVGEGTQVAVSLPRTAILHA